MKLLVGNGKILLKRRGFSFHFYVHGFNFFFIFFQESFKSLYNQDFNRVNILLEKIKF